MAHTQSQGQLDATELGAWRGMLRTHRELTARLDSELTNEHGIGLSAYEVLMFLGDSEHGRIRMSELAERLLLSRSGLTRLVDRLDAAGYVTREPCEDDGRGWFARITPAGRKKLAAARATHLSGVRRHFLSLVEPSEQRTMGAAFDRILAADPHSSA
jgi:DNA-binding MarR family transcriptional regulator